MEYLEKLKDPRWQKKRLEIFNRDKFTCQKCGDKKLTLHVHHLKYEKNKNPWDYNKKDLVTLCEFCHKVIEDIKKDDNGFEYQKCKIYKSGKTSDGIRVILCAFNKLCYISSHNKNGDYIDGYILRGEPLSAFIKILKFAENG